MHPVAEFKHHRVKLVHLALVGTVVEDLALLASAERVELSRDGVPSPCVPEPVGAVLCGRTADAAANAGVLVHAEGADPIRLHRGSTGLHLVPKLQDVASLQRPQDAIVLLLLDRVRHDRGDQHGEAAAPGVRDHACREALELCHDQLGVGHAPNTAAGERDDGLADNIVGCGELRREVGHGVAPGAEPRVEVQQSGDAHASAGQGQSCCPEPVREAHAPGHHDSRVALASPQERPLLLPEDAEYEEEVDGLRDEAQRRGRCI
mmetsp:Transcript_65397/g.191380  ORF Transcript_65397/g.191380 Transcript_65397/m.191380 type:complete len:263 (+) Transcript_65397:582-1370(+)